MKKITLILLVLSFQGVIAQQIAHIETNKVLDKINEYKQANEEIDSIAKQWEKEIEAKFNEVEQLYQSYVGNESQYTNEEKKQKQEEIYNSEQLAKEFREQKFGNEGDIKELQEIKLKPFYDQIYKKAGEIAEANNYDYVIDLSKESAWIYKNPNRDITTQVMIELNLIK